MKTNFEAFPEKVNFSQFLANNVPKTVEKSASKWERKKNTAIFDDILDNTSIITENSGKYFV